MPDAGKHILKQIPQADPLAVNIHAAHLDLGDAEQVIDQHGQAFNLVMDDVDRLDAEVACARLGTGNDRVGVQHHVAAQVRTSRGIARRQLQQRVLLGPGHTVADAPLDPRLGMVPQPGPDSGHVGDGLDAERLQLPPRSDPAQQQQVRTPHRPP